MKVTAALVPPLPVQRDVQITMPYNVAVTLRGLLNCVGGYQNDSYRVHCVALATALSEIDVAVVGRRFTGSVVAETIPAEEMKEMLR